MKVTIQCTGILLMVLFLTSCRYFEKQTLVSNDVDTLLNSKLEGYVTEEKYEEDISRIQSEVNLKIDSVRTLMNDDVTLSSNKFHMITGSFTVPENAKGYAEKMKNSGFDGNIITGYGRYNLVTAKSYNNLRTAIQDIEPVRQTTGVQAWIYISR